MTKIRKFNGITLISLVITIVILVILAGVAVNLSMQENGIFNKAKYGKEQQKMAEIKEKIELAIIDIQSEKISNNEECTIDTIISELQTKITDLTINKDGENGKGNYNGYEFTITPNLKAIINEYNSTTEDNTAKEITISDLKEGDYINYNTGVKSVGTNGIITCRVLYDEISEYGVQIISDESIANVYFEVDDWATGRISYNNAIETLNNEAKKYLNTTYATDARCVGSIPTLNNGIFTQKNSENEGPLELKFTSAAEGSTNMKDEDTNYETDYNQMTNLNICTLSGKFYWLASRRVDLDYDSDENPGMYLFRLRIISPVKNKTLWYVYFCRIGAGGSILGGNVGSTTCGFRPCFSLKTDIKITGGDGKTKDTAYTM